MWLLKQCSSLTPSSLYKAVACRQLASGLVLCADWAQGLPPFGRHRNIFPPVVSGPRSGTRYHRPCWVPCSGGASFPCRNGRQIGSCYNVADVDSVAADRREPPVSRSVSLTFDVCREDTEIQDSKDPNYFAVCHNTGARRSL